MTDCPCAWPAFVHDAWAAIHPASYERHVKHQKKTHHVTGSNWCRICGVYHYAGCRREDEPRFYPPPRSK